MNNEHFMAQLSKQDCNCPTIPKLRIDPLPCPGGQPVAHAHQIKFILIRNVFRVVPLTLAVPSSTILRRVITFFRCSNSGLFFHIVALAQRWILSSQKPSLETFEVCCSPPSLAISRANHQISAGLDSHSQIASNIVTSCI
jgi:hypothetical protein